MKKTSNENILMETMDSDHGVGNSEREATGDVKNKPVSIIIPAYNEEKAIVKQIESIKHVLNQKGIVHEIIVVDDGSSDRTREKAHTTNVCVMFHKENKGYGAALKTGINAASYETIVTIDADGTYPTDAIPELLKNANEYDMVVGARIGPFVQIPFIRKPAKWFLRKLAEYLAGRKIPDLNSGLRVMKKSLVERFHHILPSGFSFTTTMTLALYCNDYSIHYHPIDYNHRIGDSKVRPFDAYHFLILILRTIVYFNPLKVFLPLGGILFVMGLAKFIYDLFLENLSESAILGFLGAGIIWAIGLLSDQIAKMGLCSKLK
jgi:glycosyltransferase involved in cell wall biosynthesis